MRPRWILPLSNRSQIRLGCRQSGAFIKMVLPETVILIALWSLLRGAVQRLSGKSLNHPLEASTQAWNAVRGIASLVSTASEEKQSDGPDDSLI
jgi:hypothetical protein